jgi:signal transduction histidine kinase
MINDSTLISELERRFNDNKKVIAELEELTEQLKAVNKKLEESESLKSHFISNIRNEIINPFTSILNLSKQISSMSDIEKAKKSADLIYGEAFFLDFQLKNIFAAAELEAGETCPQIYAVNVVSTVQNLLDSYHNSISSKKLDIIISSSVANDFTFKSDPGKLTLIYSNLLNNAILFSKEGGKIEINLSFEYESMVFTIKDCGIGIEQDKVKLIFDRFKRLDNTINTLSSGYGLGLSVTKAITDMLNGTISVESEVGNGATFTVMIPDVHVDIEATGTAIDENGMLF